MCIRTARTEDGSTIEEYADATETFNMVFNGLVHDSNLDAMNAMNYTIRAKIDEAQERALWSFGLQVCCWEEPV